MTEGHDILLDLGRLVVAALRSGRDGTEYAERIAERLGISEGDGALEAATALREALGVPGPCVPDGDQPLTCVRCWHAPASRLLVVHWRTETMRLLCTECAGIDAADARDLPAFRMVTVLTLGPEAVIRAVTP